MIPKLYSKENYYIGDLTECSRAMVIEERNGMFELEIDYQLTSPYSDYLVRGNIIIADANDNLKNQMFRIYKVTKNIFGRFSVYCRHISYDIARDRTEGLIISNQSCEYCLNMLFRNSLFSRKFTGYSDIVNAQNYNINATNLLSAIVGERGSILDTFGTGAEILRDNYNFHVLNKRGHDNGVTIEYASNLTGLDYEEDEEGLITKIRAIAKYKDENDTEQILSTYVESDKISNYETPFVSEIDFSEKFEEGEKVTVERLVTLSEKYFSDNKCDVVKYNYKVNFIPLSKCSGYENIEDKIELCDTVTIIDHRYNLNTKAKVIKTTFNVLKNRYESMELGEPRSSLGDIIGNNDSTKGEKGDKGDKGDKGEDGSIGDFPDSLPATPIVTTKVYGFANIEISWTFENKVYYQYEVYASKEANFTPNNFNLIHSGQMSTYMYQAKPNETWYFKVCAINTHGNRTDFGSTYASTTKVDDLSNYVDEMAINEALIGTLSLDRGWVGELKGNYIDAKQLSVTDGNGKRTLDIDSFGNVSLDVTELKVNSSIVPNGDDIAINLLPNTNFAVQQDKYLGWEFWTNGNAELGYENWGLYLNNEGAILYSNDTSSTCTITSQIIPTHKGEQFTVSMDMYIEEGVRGVAILFREFKTDNTWEDFVVWECHGHYDSGTSGRVVSTHTIQRGNTNRVAIIVWNNGCYNIDLYHGVYFNRVMLERGNVAHSWRLNNNDKDVYKFSEIYQTNDKIQSTVSSIQGDYVGQSQLAQTVNDFEYKFSEINQTNDRIQSTVSSIQGDYVGRSQLTQTVDKFEFNFKARGGNKIRNSKIYETSGLYGFGWRSIEEGLPPGMYTLTVNGSSLNSSGHLEVFIYTDDWSWSSSVGVWGSGNSTNSITFYLPYEVANKPLHIGSYNYPNGSSGEVRIEWYCLTEGDYPVSQWIPHDEEIISGVTHIDNEGVKVSHQHGSYSRMNNTEFFQANESGNRTLSIRYGGTRYYKWQHDLGYVGGTAVTRVGTNDEYGINMFGTGHSHYLDLGFASNVYGDTSASITPWIRLKHWEDGIYIYKQLLSRVQFRRGFQVLRSDNGSWGGLNFMLNDSYRYCVAGDQVLSLGNIISHNTDTDSYSTSSSLEIHREGDIRFKSWGHWNFNGWTMYNMNTATVLNAQSEYLRSRHKDINEVYGTKTTDNREIRCKGKNDHTCIGETIIEIPQIIAENIQDDYQVHISKYGFGDYYIKERNPYYFVIEADREFSFDWEVVATQIEKPQAYTVIASEPYKSNVCENPNNEQEDLELHSKYALMNDDEIEVELLKEKNELYKL